MNLNKENWELLTFRFKEKNDIRERESLAHFTGIPVEIGKFIHCHNVKGLLIFMRDLTMIPVFGDPFVIQVCPST